MLKNGSQEPKTSSQDNNHLASRKLSGLRAAKEPRKSSLAIIYSLL